MLRGVSPSYLDDLICKHRLSRSIRSSDSNFFLSILLFLNLVVVDLPFVWILQSEINLILLILFSRHGD